MTREEKSDMSVMYIIQIRQAILDNKILTDSELSFLFIFRCRK
jgi:hypothetical protein